jgi:predicted metal-dependent HD superfamily phosphohydrolase
MKTVEVSTGLPPGGEDRLHVRWDDLCIRFGSFASAAEGDLTFEMVRGLYAAPPRAYHNLGHVDQCLAVFDSVPRLADHPDVVEMALWLHDCVFIAARDDNEEQSAFVAQTVAGLIGATPDNARLVHAGIMATRHDERRLVGDDALVADIDLSVLAAAPDEYDDYRRAIRTEFAFADDQLFNRGRLSFVERQLRRRHIFSTAYFRAELERDARANLERERDELHDAIT